MTKYIEVLSMDSLESKICPENCKYPLTVSHSSGGVLKGGKVVICGGGEVTSGAYPVCFSLNQTVQWNFQAVMKSGEGAARESEKLAHVREDRSSAGVEYTHGGEWRSASSLDVRKCSMKPLLAFCLQIRNVYFWGL